MISKEVRKELNFFDKVMFEEFLRIHRLEYLPAEVITDAFTVTYVFEKKTLDKEQAELIKNWKPSIPNKQDFVGLHQLFISDYRDYKRGFTDNLEYLNSAVSSLYIAVNYLMKENEKLLEGKK